MSWPNVPPPRNESVAAAWHSMHERPDNLREVLISHGPGAADFEIGYFDREWSSWRGAGPACPAVTLRCGTMWRELPSPPSADDLKRNEEAVRAARKGGA